MASKGCKKELTSEELRQHGTFLLATKKPDCDELTYTEVKLTGATRRWTKEIEELSNNFQQVPDLTRTTAFDLDGRTAAPLIGYARPEYDGNQIVSIFTALNDPARFAQILDDEKKQTSAHRTGADDIQIGNLETLVEAAKAYNQQPVSDRVTFPKTTRGGRALVLTCRLSESQHENRWLNITHLPEGKVSKSTPTVAPVVGDKKYSFVGQNSHVLISRGKTPEEVGVILSKALAMLADETGKGVEGAGEQHAALDADVKAAATQVRTSARASSAGAVSSTAATQAQPARGQIDVSQLPPLNQRLQQAPMQAPAQPQPPSGMTMASQMAGAASIQSPYVEASSSQQAAAPPSLPMIQGGVKPAVPQQVTNVTSLPTVPSAPVTGQQVRAGAGTNL